MQGIVRESKLRHVFGDEQKARFEEIRPSTLSSEGHLVESNGSFVAFSGESQGSLAVLGYKEIGRISVDHPMIRGHTGTILDFDFNPFHDQQILTSSEDATIKLWQFPEAGLQQDILEPLQTLRGHSRKVGLVGFHPNAAYICASAGFDYTLKVWNVETAEATFSFGPLADVCLSFQWDASGQLLGSTWRDKKAKIIDPRSVTVAQEFQAHEGGKAAKFCWIQDSVTCFTTGFSRHSERQYALWDVRSTAVPLTQAIIDQSAGVISPFYDSATSLLFLAGKGDGNIRYYELVNTEPYLYFLDSFKSIIPCKGVSFVPKRRVDVATCEVMKAVKLTNSSVDIISFKVPRRAEGFQADIFPDCIGTTPGSTASQWISGDNTPSPKISMETLTAFNEESKQSHSPVFSESRNIASPTKQRQADSSERNSEMDTLKAKVGTLTEDLAQSKAESKELQNALKGKEQMCQELMSTISCLEQEVDSSKEHLHKEKDLNARLKDETEMLKSHVAESRQMMMELQSELMHMKQQIEHEREENQTLVSALRSSKEETEELLVTLEQTRSECMALKSELEKASS